MACNSIGGSTAVLALVAGMGMSNAYADEAYAKQRMKAMSDSMAMEKTISFGYDTNAEIVTSDHQKLTLANSGTVALKRPDAIRAERDGGFSNVQMIFDGKFDGTDAVQSEMDKAHPTDLTLSYALTADRYAQAMGPLLMVRPRVLGRLDIDTDTKTNRTVPVDLEETMQAVDDYSIELPAGYAVDELPDPVKLDLGFAAYQSTTALEGNKLHYSRTYTVRQVTLPAEKYADLQKLAGVIAADEESRAILKKQ